MIYFRNLDIEGGLCYNKVSLPLANQGMTLLVGSNTDELAGSSNGAGKTSTFEILTHILFSTTAKGLKKNAIVNDVTKTGYHGAISANVNGVELVAHQTREHNKYGTANWLVRDGKDLKIKGLNESQAAITNAFGLTLQDWYSSVYFSQRDSHLFIRTADNDLKKAMLARIFSLNYTAYQEEAKARLEKTKVALVQLKANLGVSKSQLEMQIATMKHDAPGYLAELERLEEKNNSLDERIKNLQTKLDEYNGAKVTRATRDNYEKVIQDQLTEMSIWQGSIPSYQDFSAYVGQAEDQLKLLKDQLSQINQYLNHLQNRDKALSEYEPWSKKKFPKSIDEETKENETLKNKLHENKSRLGDGSVFNKVKELQKTLEELKSSFSEKTIDELNNHIKEYTNAISGRKALVKEKNNQYEQIKTGSCPVCNQQVSDTLLQNISKEIDTYTSEIKAWSDYVETLTKQLKVAKDSQNKLNDVARQYELAKSKIKPEEEHFTAEEWLASLEEMSTKQKQLETTIKEYAEYKKAYDKAKPFFEVEGDVLTYQTSKAEVEASVAQYTGFIAKSSQVLGTIKKYSELPVVKEIKLDELKTKGQLANLQGDKQTLAVDIALMKKELEELLTAEKELAGIKGKEKEITVLEESEQIYGGLSYAFGPKGLIVSRLEVICKHLTEQVNFFLSRIMKDNISMKFVMENDSIDLDIMMNGKSRGIGNLSGGEVAKVGLACMFGLRNLLPDKFQSNILILDEAEANFDDRVRYELVEILENMLATTQLDSIFMISHSPALQELQNWNTLWSCTKTAGISSIEVLTK